MQNSPKWRYWNVVMKHFYGCHNGLQPFPDKSQCFFLPAAALQVGPDGHEGDRMAGAELPTDRKCKESRRAHQWGIINLTLPQTQPGVYLLLTRGLADGLESLGGRMAPDSRFLSGAICNQIPRQNKIWLPVNSLSGELKACSNHYRMTNKCFYVQLWSNLTHYFRGDKERVCHSSPEFTQFNVLGLPDFRGC